MTPAFEVVVLGANDAAVLREMLSMFGQAFDDVQHYTARQPDDGYLAGLLDSKHFIALAARSRGRVVGGLAAYELPKFEQARSEIYIYDLAVAEDSRRQGVATALISGLQRIAGERDASVIFVQADHEDAPAIALYSKLGRREDVLHFDIAPAKPVR